MAMTAIAEQLEKTVLGRVSRLYILASDLLKRHGNAMTAQRYIADAVQNDPGLMRELCGDDLRALLERKAYELARKIHSDQRGDALVRDGKAVCPVPSQAGGRLPPVPQTVCAEAVTSPPTVRGREQAGLSISAKGRLTIAKPARASRRHARLTSEDDARLQAVMARSLAGFRLYSGQLLCQMSFKAAASVETRYRRDAILLRLIGNHAANIRHSVKIGDVLNEEQFQTYLARADQEAGMADAA